MKTFLSIGLLIAITSAKKLSVIPAWNTGVKLIDDGVGEDEYYINIAETPRRVYDSESYFYPNVMGDAG